MNHQQKNLRELKKLQRQAGFGLIEVIIVLIIAAAVLATVFALSSKANASSKAQQMQTDLAALTEGVRSTYAHEPTGYTNLSVEDLINAKAIPTDLSIKDKSVFDQFNKELGITTVTGGNNSFVQIQYSAVPSAVCQNVLRSIPQDTFAAIKVGTAEIYDDGSYGSAVNNLTVQEINKACNSSGTVAMAFIFS